MEFGAHTIFADMVKYQNYYLYMNSYNFLERGKKEEKIEILNCLMFNHKNIKSKNQNNKQTKT